MPGLVFIRLPRRRAIRAGKRAGGGGRRRSEARPDHSEDEERFILLGCSSGLKLLIVCHCYRANDGVIRIISARKATKREAAFY